MAPQKVKWFASAKDRDSTIFMILIFLLAVFLLMNFSSLVTASILSYMLGNITSPILSMKDYFFGEPKNDEKQPD